MRAIRLAWYATALVAVLAGSVQAKTRIAVFPLVAVDGEVKPRQTKEMTDALMLELRGSGELEPVLLGFPSDADRQSDTGRQPARTDAELRAALQQLRSGAELAEKLRFPQAIAALEKGIQGVSRNLEQLDDYQRFIDAHVLLAVCHFRRGKESAGVDVLQKVARWMPTLELDAEKYPPVFLRVFADARERALAHERASLRVTSAPAGAEVYVNGARMGATPIVVESIIPGDNHLVVKGAGSAWSKTVALGEGSAAAEHADLGAGGPDEQARGGMEDALAANRFDKDVRRLARQAARARDAELVFIGVLGAGDRLLALGSFLGNTRNGKWTALEPVAPDVDLLSATVDANKLVADIEAQAKSPKSPVIDDTLPFVAGKRVASARSAAAPSEARVTFVPARLGHGGGRSPVGASSGGAAAAVAPLTRETPRAVPEPVVVPPPTPVPPEPVRTPVAGRAPVGRDADAGTSGSRTPVVAATPGAKPGKQPEERSVREPVGSRGPVGAAAVDATAVGAVASAPTTEAEAPRRPLTRDTARGPVVRDGGGLADSERAAVAVVAATGVAGPATGPLAPADLEADAGASAPGFWNEWWFWTAVGTGTAALAGGAYFAFVYDRPVSSVSVSADWR